MSEPKFLPCANAVDGCRNRTRATRGHPLCDSCQIYWDDLADAREERMMILEDDADMARILGITPPVERTF